MGNSLTLEEFKLLLEEEMLTSIYPSPDAQVIQTPSRRPTKLASQFIQKMELHAQPIEGENECTSSASDGRKQILMTAKWPNSVHGVFAFKVNNLTSWGTGIMIGPNVVLTAGHNLYNFKSKEYFGAQSMQFLPGMNGQVLPFGPVEVEQYFVSPNYIKEEKEDYGILILKQPVGEVTGYFGLACLEPEEIRKKRINITGYPGDKVASKPNTYELWGMDGTATHIDQDKGYINYLIDTGAGQSGSGIWYKDGEDYYVCGVHIFGGWCVNRATLLTRAMYQQIHTWLQQQVNFKELSLKLRYKKLEFHKQKISAERMSLLRKYNLDNLTYLDLSDNELEQKVFNEFAQNTSWTNLSQLNLSFNGIDAEGAKALAQNISWTNLVDLDLSFNKIDKEGIKALAQGTSWANLSKLRLMDNNIGPEGAKALAQNTSWSNLSQLFLDGNQIGDKGAHFLAQNRTWVNLSLLDLSLTGIGAEGAKALAKNTSWINLVYLDLSFNEIDAEGAEALAQNASWVNLSQLYLSNNEIDAEGVKALAQNTSWASLSQLDLSNNDIDAEGAEALALNTSWTSLSQLDLSSNIIDVEGVKALAQNTSWINLSQLNLRYNNIGKEGSNKDIREEGEKALRESKTWKDKLSLEI